MEFNLTNKYDESALSTHFFTFYLLITPTLNSHNLWNVSNHQHDQCVNYEWMHQPKHVRFPSPYGPQTTTKTNSGRFWERSRFTNCRNRPNIWQKIKCPFYIFCGLHLKKKPCLKLDVCAFIISFRRFSNAKSTAENTYHDRVWHFLQFSCVQVQHYVWAQASTIFKITHFL